MDNHRGLSLIELIVVISIMAVLAGIITISVGNLSSWRLKSCAENLEKGLAQAKAVALSRDGTGLELSRVDGKLIMRIYNEPEKIIGDESISVTYTKKGNTENQVLLEDGDTLVLKFERSSGAFMPVGTEDSGEAVYCTSILLERKGKQRNIILVPPTGKFYVE